VTDLQIVEEKDGKKVVSKIEVAMP
jgi:uncharacterized protein YlaN (UPF0358 family)